MSIYIIYAVRVAPLLFPFWQVRKESVKKTVEALLSSLSDSDKADLLKAL